jgi:hypothetical protein
MQLSTQLLKTQTWSEPVHIVNISDPNDSFDETKGLRVEALNSQFKTVT